nr:hypothetical protein Q903MT_gene2710 [Picea sitchensis]
MCCHRGCKMTSTDPCISLNNPRHSSLKVLQQPISASLFIAILCFGVELTGNERASKYRSTSVYQGSRDMICF